MLHIPGPLETEAIKKEDENYREDGKVRQRVVMHLGREETVEQVLHFWTRFGQNRLRAEPQEPQLAKVGGEGERTARVGRGRQGRRGWGRDAPTGRREPGGVRAAGAPLALDCCARTGPHRTFAALPP